MLASVGMICSVTSAAKVETYCFPFHGCRQNTGRKLLKAKDPEGGDIGELQQERLARPEEVERV